MNNFYKQLAQQNPLLLRKHLKLVAFFKKSGPVLELGPAQGTFLNLMRQAEIPAWGIDSDKAAAAFCQSQGLDVRVGQGTQAIKRIKLGSLGGVFSSNVVEHLEPKELSQLLDLLCARLKVGGKLALMTSNPKNLGVHADAFYSALDHRRLYPIDLLTALLKERGMEIITACEDEDSRTQGILRNLVRKIRTLFIGPFFGPPEIYVAAVKVSATVKPGSGHLTFRR